MISNHVFPDKSPASLFKPRARLLWVRSLTASARRQCGKDRNTLLSPCLLDTPKILTH